MPKPKRTIAKSAAHARAFAAGLKLKEQQRLVAARKAARAH
jgi:hypothetical protein